MKSILAMRDAKCFQILLPAAVMLAAACVAVAEQAPTESVVFERPLTVEGRQHRNVRIPKELRTILGICREDRDPDTCGRQNVLPMHPHRNCHRRENSLGDRLGIDDVRELRCNYGEFVSANTRDRIHISDVLRNAIGSHSENFVSRRMPQRIVDLFEVVQVDKYQPYASTTPLSARRLLGKPVDEQRAIRNAG